MYLVDFLGNLSLKIGTVDNSQTVRIKKSSQSTQEIRKRNITNWKFNLKPTYIGHLPELNEPTEYKRRYCVIVYVDKFWPPNFGPISVRSLLYMLTSPPFTKKYFLRLPLLVLSVHGLRKHYRGVHVRGGRRGPTGGENCSQMCTQIIMAYNLLCQPEARWQAPVRLSVLQGTGELISMDHSWIWPRKSDHNWDPIVNTASHMRNGLIHFSAMSGLKFSSTTRASLPRILSTEIKNGEIFLCCLWQWLSCLSLFIFSHWTRSVTIGSNL